MVSPQVGGHKDEAVRPRCGPAWTENEICSMADVVTAVGREGVQRLFYDRMREDIERLNRVFSGRRADGVGDYCSSLIADASELGLQLGWALAQTPGQHDDFEEWLQAAIKWAKLENYEPPRFEWDNFT